MIELSTGNNIHMFEVQVIDEDNNDVAASKPSSQSSTFKQFNASRAVDGDVSTFSHTDVSVQTAASSLWWKVALGDEFHVKFVAIKNRYCGSPSDSASCLCRLTNATVSLLDYLGNPVATKSVGDTCEQQDLLLTDFIPFETPEPTPSPTVSLLPTVSSAPSTGPVDGFTYVGPGWCLDFKGKYYSSFSTYLYDANNNDCMAWCSQVQHPDFVGAEMYDYGGGKIECYCDFSGGLPDDLNGTDYSPAATSTSQYSGVGPVQTFKETNGASCYRFEVSGFSFSSVDILFVPNKCVLILISASAL
jgi:hypothetical protein